MESVKAMSTSTCLDRRLELLPVVPIDAGRTLSSGRVQWRFACVVVTAIFFLADFVLPRGATPAIGYCLVPVLARGTGRRSFVLWFTGICTVLTWIGFFVEPAGASLWMSVFDRGMVS